MSSLIALSITTAILCAIWTYLSGVIGILGWIGFAGCTSFFAAGGKKEGFKASIVANISGVFWAMITIKLSSILNFNSGAAIATGLITFVMCAQAKNKYLAFIPGTFLGSFSTFAASGDWKAVLSGLICGAFLGYACEWTGNKLYEKVEKE
ncbi:DUF1097 domain-containing protein [Clostridium tetani]|uniref:Glutathione-regulated potassium-efflux system protein n=1 Tax=Clostridium tetani (strain Massachusetts / E88) TaxID=212717 RepID=Q893N4_CLOTE|nr:DUF1097 domain-containing protein [Clostridium tetani]AAO36308.1 glutathione-regulated potassium-efflux system protein [Clostridium tetani E88]KGI37727.1 membrane protein [Clostridium tetani]KGI39653.1 membrane protein [Clostridium tetani ATCC 9441]KGI44198.1 membrane protein [Clostridium tetani]KGI45552.1 membrane protein [Clostridium tetani]